MRTEAEPKPIACCAPLGAPTLDDDEAVATAELFRSLADPARVRIVNLLATSAHPVCACDLYADGGRGAARRRGGLDLGSAGGIDGCITALSEAEYEAGLEDAGLTEVAIELTHRVADGMHGAIVKARKPE
jgi:DNA-binding transcriptional ArsR family regulator